MSSGSAMWRAQRRTASVQSTLMPGQSASGMARGGPMSRSQGARAAGGAAAGSGAAVDPDVAVMLRWQAAHQGAFQGLFRKFSPRVLQSARRLVGSEARAEELTQDVFIQVFRFRHRYQPQSR